MNSPNQPIRVAERQSNATRLARLSVSSDRQMSGPNQPIRVAERQSNATRLALMIQCL